MDQAEPPETAAAAAEAAEARRRQTLPLAALVLALALALAAGVDHRVSIEALRADAVPLGDWAARNALLAPPAVLLAAAAAAAIALPGAAVIAMAAGLMLGAPVGSVTAALGSAAGGCVFMLAARAALRPMLRRSDAPLLLAGERVLQRHPFWPLLALRLALPFAPFLAALIAAALGARLKPFALASFAGALPASFLLARNGARIAAGEPSAGADLLLAWPALALGLALALLALLPMLAGRTGR